MKKVIFSFVLLIFLGFSAHAQLTRFGLQGGINYSIKPLMEESVEYSVEGGQMGFHGGLFVRHEFEKFFIGADVNYNAGQGGTVEANGNTYDLNIAYLNLPVLLGKKFYSGFEIFAGVDPHVYLGNYNDDFGEFFNDNTSGNWAARTPAVNALFGLGMDLSRFFVDVRYELPLAGSPLILEYVDGDVETSLSQVVLTVGFKLN